MEPPILQELPIEVRNTLRSGVTVPNVAQCIVELILNSLDAGASSIAIRVNLVYHKIQVVDNGCGIDIDSLNLVGLRYMTSKCTSLEDLRKYLGLFGFRGEALASLRNISKVLTIESRPHGCDDTFYKVFKKGKVHTAIKSDSNRPARGTTVTIHDFMYNMPVRQQRINDAIDLEEIKILIEAIALVHSDVSFSLRNDVNGTIILQTQRTHNKLKTFASLFGDEISESLVPVKHNSNKFKIKGYISREAHLRKHLQFIYVNKRVVRKTKLHTLVNSKLAQSSIRFTEHPRPNVKRKSNGNWIAYTPPTKRDRFPVYILNIKCAPIEYDICSDPKKTLIEFLDWSSVLKCMEEALEMFLEAAGLVETKGSDCVDDEVQESPSDQAALAILKCYEGPVLEIGRCVRSRPAVRKESSKAEDSSSFSPNKSLVSILADTGPDIGDNQNSARKSQLSRNVSAECKSPAVLVDEATPSASDASSKHSMTNEVFTPALRSERCPSEDPFPSTFKKIIPLRCLQKLEAKKICHSSLSSLSEDPIGKKNARANVIGRCKRSHRPYFHRSKNKPLNQRNSLSEDPLNGSNWKRTKTPLKFISRRKDLLNKVERVPKVTGKEALICRASSCSDLPCNKNTPANSEEARVSHVFCHPLLTNVDENPEFVGLQDAIRMDKLSIALKKCSAHLKRKGVLRIKETEITIKQRVEIPSEVVNKTPEEVLNCLKSPYFSLKKASDFIFKVPNVSNLVTSRVINKDKIVLKPNHRSPYFTSPTNITPEKVENTQFIFCPQLSVDRRAPTISCPVSCHRRLNVAFGGDLWSEDMITPRYGDGDQDFRVEIRQDDRALADIAGLYLQRDRPRTKPRNVPNDAYLTSSDMIKSLHRSCSKLHYEDFWKERDVYRERNRTYGVKCVSHTRNIHPQTVSCNQEPSVVSREKPLSQEITSELLIRQTPCHSLSTILEEDLDDSSDVHYAKLLSIERKYHCFSACERDRMEISNQAEKLEDNDLGTVSLNSSRCSSSRTANGEVEYTTLISENIIFPQTEVVFVSSDDSSAQDMARNDNAYNSVQRELVLKSSDQISPRSERLSTFIEGNVLSQRRSQEEYNKRSSSKRRKKNYTHNSDDCDEIELGKNPFSPEKDISPNRIANEAHNLDTAQFSSFANLRAVTQISNTPLKEKLIEPSYCDEDIIPNTPKLDRSLSRASQTKRNSEPVIEASERVDIDKEWVQMVDGNGRAFFVHGPSGMTSFEAPAAVGGVYSMTKRYCFLPKGISPILENKAVGEKTNDLSQRSRDNVLKAVLDAGQAQEELSVVKWKGQNLQSESVIEKIQEFSKKNGKFCEASVPDAFIQGRNALKCNNLISSYTFTKEIFSCINLLGQVDKKFIVAIVSPEADGHPHVMVFFDQHAVHERVRLEMLMRDYHLDGSDTHFKSSPVDPPIPITLTEQEARIASHFPDELRRLGVELTSLPSAASATSVTAVPTCVAARAERDAVGRRRASLQGVVETLVREVVGQLIEARGTAARVPHTLQNIINSEACRGAIKFGDTLNKADCLGLLTQLCQCELPFQCAHGRPSIAPIADLRSLLKSDKIQSAKPNYSNLKKYID